MITGAAPDEGGGRPAGQLRGKLFIRIAGQLMEGSQDVSPPREEGPPVGQRVDAAQREVEAVTWMVDVQRERLPFLFFWGGADTWVAMGT